MEQNHLIPVVFTIWNRQRHQCIVVRACKPEHFFCTLGYTLYGIWFRLRQKFQMSVQYNVLKSLLTFAANLKLYKLQHLFVSTKAVTSILAEPTLKHKHTLGMMAYTYKHITCHMHVYPEQFYEPLDTTKSMKSNGLYNVSFYSAVSKH